MSDYHLLTMGTLMDMLSEQTRQYTQLMAEGFKNGAEFSQIEQRILSIQKAINARMHPAQKDVPPATE